MTIRKRSSPSRVTVKSHSIPPRAFSICVYVIAPMSRTTRLAQRRSSSAAAPSPDTSILANEVSSNSAAASRQARCSAPIAGDQCLPAQPRGRRPSSPAGAFELEPVRALPARFLAERGPELLQPAVGRGNAERPPGLSLVRGVLDVVVGRVDLLRPRERVLPAPVRGAEAARVHLPHVEARRSLDDPLGDELPIPPAPASPWAQKPAATQNPRTSARAEDELAVRGERLRPVDQLDDLQLLERRHPPDRVLEQRLEARPVLRQQLAVEIGRDPVERPRQQGRARSRP